MGSLGEMLEACAENFGEKTALVVEETRLSYAELNDMVNRAGNALKRLGVEKGDRVTLLLPNSIECVVAFHGVAKIGAVINPLNVMYRADEIRYIMGDAGSKAVIAIPECLPIISELRKELPSLETVITTGEGDEAGAASFHRLLEESAQTSPLVPCQEDDFLFFPYTSGTTGKPKGAQLTHGNMTINAEMSAMAHIINRHDCVITALPLFHVFGGNVVMNGSFLAGATLVVLPAFDAEKTLQAIQEHRATVFEAVPTMFSRMVNLPNAAAYDTASLDRCVSAGAPLPLKVMEDFEAAFNTRILEAYGLTETGLAASNPVYGRVKPGSVGIPCAHTSVKVVDDSGNELPPEETGEIVIKSPAVMKGYRGLTEANAEALRGGWFHTGDLGRVDEDGYLYIVDRKKDMIITGGYNVYPAEVENALCAHPDIAMAAAVGVPDDERGEVVKAFVVLKEGAEAPSAEDIVSFCRERIAPYKAPRLVEFMDSLPTSSVGKILRRELR